jgi:phosphatidylglycerol---prolipoprotein diacylglyceryl transferase
MRQVLFYIGSIPIHGYGMMLFLAFLLCSWLAGRLARRERINPNVLPDLAIYLFVSGILGARFTFVIQEWPSFFGEDRNWLRVFALWDGGLVLYGAIIGGAIGYIFAHRRLIAPEGISAWKMVDVVAPCLALGVCLGRIGCFLTGCCFGNVACAGGTCPVEFPLPSAPLQEMAKLGYQTLAGFTFGREDLTVSYVEPGSPAAAAGLQGGDRIVEINGVDVTTETREKLSDGREMVISRDAKFRGALLNSWPPGVRLKVKREEKEDVELAQFLPWSLPLYPTQLFETISMALLMFFLLSYYPYKTRDGAVLVFLMLGYGVHRFLNEMLRIDNDIVAFDMTFSQLVSILVLAGAAVLAYLVFIHRSSETPPPTTSATVTTW